jgi:hypothetical protein
MKGTGHLKEIEMIVKGKNVNLDISYKRRRVLWRRAAASFERSAGNL